MRRLLLVSAVSLLAGALFGVGMMLTKVWPYSVIASLSKPMMPRTGAEARISAMVDLYRAFPTSAHIVFVGDSRVQTPHWQDFFPGSLPGATDMIANRGVAGATFVGLAENIADLGILSPDLVVLQLGINDVLRGLPPEETARAAESVIEHLAKTSGRLIVMEIIDCAQDACDRSRVSALNSALKTLAEKHGALFLEVNDSLAGPAEGLKDWASYDGIHLTAAGYGAMLPPLCASIGDLSCE